MPKTTKSIVAAVMVVAVCFVVGTSMAYAQSAEIDSLIEEFLSGDDFFMTMVVQRGRLAGAHEEVVTIERWPFDLVLVFRDPSSPEISGGSSVAPAQSVGVLVNFSFRDEICRGFREGKTLDEILQNPDDFMGMAEHPLNPDEKIVVDEVVPHYLYFASSDDHRFSRVTQKDGVIICERHIAYYSHLESIDDKNPIEQIQSDALFVSILHSKWGKNFERIEIQKQCLEIRFGQ